MLGRHDSFSGRGNYVVTAVGSTDNRKYGTFHSARLRWRCPGRPALAAPTALGAPTALAGTGALTDTGAGTPMPGSLAVLAGIRAAARQPAPLVTDAIPARTKRGLAAPAMTAVMFRANAVKQAMARAFLRVMSSQAGPDGKCVSRACRARLPVAVSLQATQQPQVNNYYCGPATVSEMLEQVGVSVRQRAAARELKTTRGGTDWSDSSGYPVPSTLKRGPGAEYLCRRRPALVSDQGASPDI